MPNCSPSSASPRRGGWRGRAPSHPLQVAPCYVGHTLGEAAAERPRSLRFPPGARSPGSPPRRRRAIEIGFGLLKRPGEAAAGNTICQTPTRCFAPPEGEGERRRGGSGCARPPPARGPSAPRPFPLAPSPRSFPRGRRRPSQLPRRPSIPTPSAPPFLPPPAFLRVFRRLVGRAQPPAVTLPPINKRGVLDNNRGTSLQHPIRRRNCARAPAAIPRLEPGVFPSPAEGSSCSGKARAPLLAAPPHLRGEGTPGAAAGEPRMGAEICPRFPQVHDSGRIGHIPAQPPFPWSLRLPNTQSQPVPRKPKIPNFTILLKSRMPTS